ncbi:hypothetical protein [Paenibacillus dendritiformis]|uniref:hypothetical protein n=1 Tax=Paenibacillus dendritiformis TaxID=130049 RepID=UPI0002EA70C2|nr:hypothetical protein [Paenibacillus dendritiformis]CAH8772496.1 hypothetical protein H7S4_005237 [Paenibacillus dendritiformis]
MIYIVWHSFPAQDKSNTAKFRGQIAGDRHVPLRFVRNRMLAASLPVDWPPSGLN